MSLSNKSIFGGVGQSTTQLTVNESLTVYGPIVSTGSLITNQDVLALTGTVTGNSLISNGNISATSGVIAGNVLSSLSTIVAGTNITATSGSITGLSLVSNSNITASSGTISGNVLSSTTTVSAGTDITATGKYLNMPRYLFLNSGANLSSSFYIGHNFQSATIGFAQFYMPSSCNVTSVIVRLTAASGVGANRQFRIQNNGANLTTISMPNQQTGSFTGSLAYAAGDLLSVLHNSTGTPTAAAVSITITFINT